MVGLWLAVKMFLPLDFFAAVLQPIHQTTVPMVQVTFG